MVKRFLRGLSLLCSAVLLSGTITLLSLIILTPFSSGTKRMERSFSAAALAEELTESGGAYTLSDKGTAILREAQSWVILLDADGRVIWSADKPADVPNYFTLPQVASFTRWYLNDYPVTVWQYGGGLLVAGQPKGSAWKYSLTYSTQKGINIFCYVPLLFFVLLTGMLLLGRHSFRKEQAQRDAARSRWINGISHDIRTPLSVVMGYADEWQSDDKLPGPRRQQAAAMVAACTAVKALVADLNLTMRLDYEMQPLRKERVSPAALIRAAAAEALNSGLEAELDVRIAPEAEALRLNADPVLLHRALMNLIQNAVRHGGSGAITLGVAAQGRRCRITVTNPCAVPLTPLLRELNEDNQRPDVAGDGTAAHGTGLHLVRQVAKAHHGRVRFSATAEGQLCAGLWLPLVCK